MAAGEPPVVVICSAIEVKSRWLFEQPTDIELCVSDEI
jgi:hypothetical protein